MKENARIIEYDYIKGILIFLVIWGHFIQFVGVEVNNPVHVWIYSFHMPLFIFISGFFSQKLYSRSFLSFISKQIKHLILPNFIWATLALIILVPIGIKSFVWNINSFISLYTDFWFLWTVFISSIIYYICCKVYYKLRYVMAAIMAIFIYFFLIYSPPLAIRTLSLPFFITMLPYMYPIYILGILYKDYKEMVDKYFRVLMIVSTVGYIGLLCYVLLHHYSISNVRVSLRFSLYVTGCIFYFYSWLYVFKQLNLNVIKLELIGRQTLGIYIIQHVIFYWIFERFSENISTSNPIIICLLAIAMTYICYYIVVKISKNRFHQFLLG